MIHECEDCGNRTTDIETAKVHEAECSEKTKNVLATLICHLVDDFNREYGSSDSIILIRTHYGDKPCLYAPFHRSAR